MNQQPQPQNRAARRLAKRGRKIDPTFTPIPHSRHKLTGVGKLPATQRG